MVAWDEPEAESVAKAKFSGKTYKLEQDPDVLDMRFSSGLYSVGLERHQKGKPSILSLNLKQDTTFYSFGLLVC